MPHATNTTTTTTMTNGDSSPKTSAKFLSHLQSYPVVSDSVTTFQNHPYGKKSLEIADGVYTKYGKAVEPYLEKPYGYAKPYVAKADELADTGLSRVDERFPIVKEETGSLVEKGKGVVWWPFSVAGQGRDYVMNTWNGESGRLSYHLRRSRIGSLTFCCLLDEYTKTASHKSRGPGLTTSLMAIVSTELKIASDFFQAVADFLGPKYEESKTKAHQYSADAKATVDGYVQEGKEYQAAAVDKAAEYAKFGEQKAEEAKKVGGEKVEQGKKEAQRAQAEAGKKVQGQGQGQK